MPPAERKPRVKKAAAVRSTPNVSRSLSLLVLSLVLTQARSYSEVVLLGRNLKRYRMEDLDLPLLLPLESLEPLLLLPRMGLAASLHLLLRVQLHLLLLLLLRVFPKLTSTRREFLKLFKPY